MQRFIKRISTVAAVLAGTGAACAFSLQGPITPWMTPRIGYQDILPNALYGGPMSIGEEYRWNVPEVFYGFTPEFINFFGAHGMAQVDEAFQILNSVPPASRLSIDSYPLNSQRMNFRANGLGLIDLKSFVLGVTMEQLGLSDPARYVFTLRNRWTTTGPDTTNYFIIRRNYDPATWQPTSYINGNLWTYVLVADIDPTHSWVFNEPVDPGAYAGLLNSPVSAWQTMLLSGGFWTSLTRDDVGGLRYVYRPDNYQIEGMAASITGTGGGPWGQPSGGTNVVATNSFVNTGVRGGIDKVRFRRVDFDSLLGFYVPFTNRFSDSIITNSTRIPQFLERGVAAPDILFHASDLQGGDATLGLFLFGTAFQGWAFGNSATNAAGTNANFGPGVIGPGVGGPAFLLTLQSVGEVLVNTIPFDNQDEVTALRALFFGSFDGTTNDPVVYPVGIDIREVEALVLSSARIGNPWGQPPGSIITNAPPGGGATVP